MNETTAPIPDQTWKQGERMALGGMAVLWLGIAAVVISWLLPTSIGDIANLSRMHTQLVVLYSGMGLAMIGAILFAAGKIINALKS